MFSEWGMQKLVCVCWGGDLWQWMKHAKLYSELLQALVRDPLIALDSVQRGPLCQSQFRIRGTASRDAATKSSKSLVSRAVKNPPRDTASKRQRLLASGPFFRFHGDA